jgi:hypothetical protein
MGFWSGAKGWNGGDSNAKKARDTAKNKAKERARRAVSRSVEKQAAKEAQKIRNKHGGKDPWYWNI